MNKLALMEYFELNDYLLDFKDYKEMDYEDRATACILIYNNYTKFALLKDLYLISDYVVDEKEGIEYILSSFY